MADLAQILQYEGDNTTFIWKHPRENFNTLSQLIVHESQEAVLFLNGQALDLFGPGRHTLRTQNIPLLCKALNWPTGGETPFHCEVYFINKAVQMAIKWGTDSRVQYLEPTYRFPLEIGACGEMALCAVDSRRLLVSLVGTERDLSQAALVHKFRALMMTKVKSGLGRALQEQKFSIFEVDSHLDELSAALRELLAPAFEEYGVGLEQFFVTAVARPDGDAAYEKFKELHIRQYADVAEAQLRQQVGIIDQQTQAQRMVIEAQALAQKRMQEGYTYQQERGFDVAEKAMENQAVGQFTNLGVGMGIMTGVGGTLGGAVSGAVSGAMNAVPAGAPAPQAGVSCPACGAAGSATAAFCSSCGAPLRTAKCPQCGFVFTGPGSFCPGCGAKREEQA